MSEAFNNFCKEAGITRHMTVKGTPQQNGLAERMNRTILEKVRCMLLSFGCCRKFWGEATKIACYLINRSPSTAIEFKTPREIWTGKPPSLNHLRVFGCATYAHTRQNKLEARALKCIFLGYPEGVKGYKLWCTEPGKQGCSISRDVTFNEDERPLKSEDSNSDKKKSDMTQFEVELDQLNQDLKSIESDDTELVHHKKTLCKTINLQEIGRKCRVKLLKDMDMLI